MCRYNWYYRAATSLRRPLALLLRRRNIRAGDSKTGRKGGPNPENMPIATAAIDGFDSHGGLHIRVYSTDGYTVSERCNDGGGWYAGAFSQSGSAVSAICWNASDGTHIRVYGTA
jgi:fucose-binding lectin